ncbi:hypothetical protein P3342_006210 [Pyrenophora teres f. teres]|nr:hypothetical protein PTNB85_01405 [Pyrenophora teres f. teres]KAE8854277.1 hypothetical protein HRS9122_01269 [Pyrenophora teres f. teres]KAE8867496.1 hypothetical protein PTNB29_01407 [Pyrenophora teres f. teres]KAE8872259.1 hypothetical protein PTNB73_01410 [Pyrenophora teres f. teres]KAK1907880.1 hypothetical protein P3342_006210 [Pyrenophora teres f. teres]
MYCSMASFASLLALVPATFAVSMTHYKAGSGVDAAFKDFVEEYYRTSEDKAAADTFTDFWTTDGTLRIAANSYQGYARMLAVKQNLLPKDGNKAWWHLINGTSVRDETTENKTIVADIVIQTTYTPGNCSQAYGQAAFTVLKDKSGKARLEAHSQSLHLYDLVVSTTASPTDIKCTT